MAKTVHSVKYTTTNKISNVKIFCGFHSFVQRFLSLTLTPIVNITVKLTAVLQC